MTSLRDFVAGRLDEDQRDAETATGPWTAYAIRYFNEESVEFGSIHAAFCWLADNDSCEKHVPDRICGPDGTAIVDLETMTRLDHEGSLDEKQGAFESWLHEHHPLLGANPARVLREVTAKRRVLARHCRYDGTDLIDYCAGCPTGDETGYPETELKDCPELQDMAFIWNESEAWNQEWCPHVEGRHEVDVIEVPPARGCYTNACNRCGAGDGWHYRDRSTT